MVIDHINHNMLDNRRSNLRIVTRSMNSHNRRSVIGSTSRYKGVHQSYGKWQAAISHKDKNIHLGVFSTEAEAAKRYDEAAQVIWGAFASTNFEAKCRHHQVGGDTIPTP